MTNTLRVGVVGAGIGSQHIEAFRALPERFEVAAICDLDETRAREVATANNIPHIVTNFSEFCQRDDLDLIDLCTPSYLHFLPDAAGACRWKTCDL